LLVLLSLFSLLPLGTKDLISFKPVPQEPPYFLINSGDKSKPKSPNDLNLLEAISTIDFWLLFFCFMGGIGSGVVVVNNFAEIIISKLNVPSGSHYEYNQMPNAKSILTIVALFSVFNTFGRIIVGFLSDKFIFKMERVWWLVICLALMCETLLYFSFATIPMIYFGVVTLGLAYGGMFCVLPTITSEFFGLAHFGANWGFAGVAPAVGSELFSVLLAGRLNDKFEKEAYVNITQNGNTSLHCLGPNCYRWTFFVTAGICLWSAILALVLKCRRSYQKIKLGATKDEIHCL